MVFEIFKFFLPILVGAFNSNKGNIAEKTLQLIPVLGQTATEEEVVDLINASQALIKALHAVFVK
jgi:hypothetical protein